jgi:hypothetical protein
MKIDITSDLHVDSHLTIAQRMEFIMNQGRIDNLLDWTKLKNDGSTTLLIAGDISHNLDLIKKTLLEAKGFYDHIVYTDGNHESYSATSHSVRLSELESFCGTQPGIHYLNENSHNIQIDDVLFVGSNGWYDWKAYEWRGVSKEVARDHWVDHMNDWSDIKFDNGDPDQLSVIHANHILNDILVANQNDSIRSIVVMTHTVPSEYLVKFDPTKHVSWHKLTPSFINTDMEKVFDHAKEKVKLWVYGHTHVRQCTEHSGIDFINNARGYNGEIPSKWSPIQVEI